MRLSGGIGMVSGDIVNGVSNSAITFQPSAGTQICITSVLGGNATQLYSELTNGVIFAVSMVAKNNDWSINGNNTKIMITNTNYLRVNSGGGGMGYSGIQI